jgi:hypothetical protein
MADPNCAEYTNVPSGGMMSRLRSFSFRVSLELFPESSNGPM